MKHLMVTGITYHGVKFSNNHCPLEAIEKTMHHRSCAISELLAMAKCL